MSYASATWVKSWPCHKGAVGHFLGYACSQWQYHWWWQIGASCRPRDKSWVKAVKMNWFPTHDTVLMPTSCQLFSWLHTELWSLSLCQLQNCDCQIIFCNNERRKTHGVKSKVSKKTCSSRQHLHLTASFVVESVKLSPPYRMDFTKPPPPPALPFCLPPLSFILFLCVLTLFY